MGDKILKSLQFPGSSDVYKIPQSDYAQTDSTQPDYIKNKLVGKEVTYSDTLTWDGNTDGLESAEGVFYKVSDATPTFEDFANGGIVRIFHTDGGTIEFTQEQIISDGNYLMLPEGVAIVAFKENVDIDGMVLPKKGIYFVNNQSGGILTDYLKINGYTGFPTITTKKLTAEYLEPFEVVTKGGDTLTWDGDTSGLESVADMFFRISDIVPTINDLKDGAIMTFNSGTEIELVASDNGDVILLSDENGPLVIITKVDNVIFSEIPFGSSGIYVMFADPSEYMVSLEIPNFSFATTEKKLKGEYLIDTNSIILKSSGGKRFKVTVSDTGTLTATEI